MTEEPPRELVARNEEGWLANKTHTGKSAPEETFVVAPDILFSLLLALLLLLLWRRTGPNNLIYF
jgi:hypothetical protein